MSAVIVSVGAQTALGLDARQTGFLLRAGFPAMSEAPLASAAGEAITMAYLPTLPGDLTGPERLAALLRGPFREAVSPIHDLAGEAHIAVDEGSFDEGSFDEGLTVSLLTAAAKRIMPEATVRVAPRGEAAPGAALLAALGALESRRADRVVIGGVHSDYDPRVIAALEASGRLFARDNLDARIPGEAAAFFVLMRAADAARQRLPALARVLGVGSGRERATPDNDEPAYQASGLTAAARRAVESLAGSGRAAGWLLTDLTFEMWRQAEWQSTFVRLQEALGRPYYLDAPAQRIGYLGAAALPLFVAMCATAWRHGYAPSPLALLLAGNDGGDRAAVLLEGA